MSDPFDLHMQGGGAALPQKDVSRAGAKGTTCGGVEWYYGIRYGRLSKPDTPRSRVAPATGQVRVRHLTEVPVFPQLPSRLEALMGPGIGENPQSDEAFYLNVWTPKGGTDLPVMVFLHGGAWVSGGGAARWYRGAALAAEGMVVVTLNYRIGPNGHLEEDAPYADQDPTDHRPMEDILTALQWVKDHICDFGGDANRITLAGQSAGAWYAWALAGWSKARGLFDQLALLSIPQISPWSATHRSTFTRDAVARCKEMQCQGEPQETTLLRAGAEVLSRHTSPLGAMAPMYLPVWPVAAAETPLHVAALYVRVTDHEMSVFLPQLAAGSKQDVARLSALRAQSDPPNLSHACPKGWSEDWSEDWAETVARASWLSFGAFAEAIAKAAEECGRKVIRRQFAARSDLPGVGAAHCFDLPFQFGNPVDWHDAPMLDGWSTEAFEALSQEMRADLAAFVLNDPQPLKRRLGMPLPTECHIL
ncbi:para-nitrobenzyl esterase [Celeribacter baekdonensis]|uniref:Carboxylic ester hydrolase n=1 Tax=Celeribacter baekdonensis TaxID=875171 RepID=A0A1G7R8M7_9RHOB|nr:carboxylesterase family protein [Celeribacter baekdonensis]SDG07083.1 para-nitrobenzyl esterase [Celeribacter baekdonensis]